MIVITSVIKKTGEFVDRETGELENGYLLQKNIFETHILVSKNQINSFKKIKAAKEDLVQFNNIVGSSFTFTVQESVKELFNNESFSDAEKVHTMYLSSYVNYNGYLMTNNNKPATKQWVFDKLKIKNKKRLYTFYNKLVKHEFIIEDSNRLYWNQCLGFKGSTQDKGIKSNKVFKTYDKTIQTLYRRNNPKSLAIIFRLLPYLNKYHNVICRNVNIREYEDCMPFSITEVAELLGEKDFRNLKQKLLRIRLEDDFIFSIRNTGTSRTVIMNPSLAWLSSSAPPNNLVGDFSIAKSNLMKRKFED